MGRLFLFGIGGTGSRVVKALTFLLAAGVNVKVDEIIPIIIDPDKANGDLNRTFDLLKRYQKIHGQTKEGKSEFFSKPILTLRDLAPDNEDQDQRGSIHEGFQLSLKGVDNERFRDFIDFGSLNPNDRYLIELLFSEENLDADMEVGFKGNPNIGSVVLNQLSKSPEFRYFASNFTPDDRIFIVSSIFGGTGAAGFPLLLKNLRDLGDNYPNHAILRDSSIGAVTLQPYFGVEDNESSAIDKSTFYAKTKAALSYYARNISGNDSLNVLYYLGDTFTKDYANNEGSITQRNDAHLIELIAALAVVDYANTPAEELKSVQGRAIQPVFKEYGARVLLPKINFTQMGDQTRKKIQAPLTQLTLFHLYLKNQLSEALGKDRQAWTERGVELDSGFFNSAFYQTHVSAFFKHYEEWLVEMDKNKRAFMPFNLAIEKRDLYGLVNGVTEKKGGWFGKRDYVLFDHTLNTYEKSDDIQNLSKEAKFLMLFERVTKQLVNQKINF